MHISRIEIKNFRNFRHLVLRTSPTTVIVGENGSGKTNLIHALRLVLDPDLPDSARRLRAEDFWDGLNAPLAGDSIEIVVELQGMETRPSERALCADLIVATDPLTARLTYRFQPRSSIGGGQVTEEHYDWVIFGGQDEKNRVGGGFRRWASLRVLPALRDAEGDMHAWRRSPLRPLLERLEPNLDKDHMANILAALQAATDGLLAEQPVKDLVDSVAQSLTDMVGETYAAKPRLGFASPQQSYLLRAIRLFVGDDYRALSDAGLGTANVLFLALLAHDIEESRRAGESVTTFLAVEEPEAHLHPHLQRLVFRYFLRREAPLLVTTHSPHIASVAPLKSLAVLRPQSGTGTSAFTTQDLALTDLEEADLERYLDVTRAEMLFAKGVILVEGPGELFLLPAFARSLGIDLDQLGITVCSVHGTDFAPYRKLMSSAGLAIPNVVVTDGDPKETQSEIVPAGIIRGLRLASWASDTPPAIKSYIDNRDWDKLDAELANIGIFVGMRTLETDLIPGAGEIMTQAYRDLVAAGSSREVFAGAVGEARGKPSGRSDAGADAESRILGLIERIGKGRFAQRLAARIDGHKPPPYIAAAIKRIVSLVRSQSA